MRLTVATLVEVVDELDLTVERDPVAWSRGVFRAERIRLVYQHGEGDGPGWRCYAIVSGTRIRKNGSLGAPDANQMFSLDVEGTPEWVTDYLLANMPPLDGVLALEEWARHHPVRTVPA